MRAHAIRVYASSSSLLTAARATYSQTTFAPRYSQASTPTTYERNALPLSDAQRKTIYALSTPPGKSGVAIIRVSGPDALDVWQRMIRSTRVARTISNEERRKRKRDRDCERIDNEASQLVLPEVQKLERCRVVDPHTSHHLDDALAVFFRGAPISVSHPSLPLTRQRN